MPADIKHDIGRIGAAVGMEVSQPTWTGDVGSGSDLVAHLLTLF